MEGSPIQWGRERQALEALSSLSASSGDLRVYLQEIAAGVSRLIELDWSVVTLCQGEEERILASSVPLPQTDPRYALHGTLTQTVLQTGQSLAVADASLSREYGSPPTGYQAYLGVPLRTLQGKLLGTICSFHRTPRQFTPADLQIVELFAERAATAIDNYQLYQQQREFNEALEQALEEAKARLLEQERLAAVGQFCALIVHEIRNPLATLALTLEFFCRQRLSPLEQERLDLAQEEMQRLERLLNELLSYSKMQVMAADDLRVLDLNRVLQQVHRWWQEETPDRNSAPIQFSPAPGCIQIRGHEDRLKQVFLNLLRNATEAVDPPQPIRWWVETDPQNQWVWIKIHNGGDPIPAEILPRVTELFYTTKSSGTGLGLAIVKQIVLAHGGELQIDSSAAAGTTVSVGFPWVSSKN